MIFYNSLVYKIKTQKHFSPKLMGTIYDINEHCEYTNIFHEFKNDRNEIQ